MKIIDATHTIGDVVKRNVRNPDSVKAAFKIES